MTMLKKTLLASAAIAVMTGFVGCGDSGEGPVAAQDKKAPEIEKLSPVDDANPVEHNTNLMITFNENIKAGSGKIYIKKTSDDAVFEEYDINDSKISISGMTLTIDPSKDFDFETGYYVTVDDGAVSDEKGNKYTGFSDKAKWNFTVKKDGQIVVVADWKMVFDSAFVKFEYDSSKTDDIKYRLTLTDNMTEGKKHYYSIAHLMVAESKNFTNLEKVIIGYSVPTENDSISFGIVKDYDTDFAGTAYNYFRQVLTTGKKAPGTVVYDTLDMAGFGISWEGGDYSATDNLGSGKGAEFRKTANAFRFELEEPDTTKNNVTTFTLHELKLIGPGIGADLGQTGDTAWVLGTEGWTGMGGSYE